MTKIPTDALGRACPEVTDKIAEYLDLVGQERIRQLRTWGVQWRSQLMWNLILGEEVGEVAEALFAQQSSMGGQQARAHLKLELIQVAAVAIAMAQSLDHGEA